MAKMPIFKVHMGYIGVDSADEPVVYETSVLEDAVSRMESIRAVQTTEALGIWTFVTLNGFVIAHYDADARLIVRRIESAEHIEWAKKLLLGDST